eukprot:8657124-Ditylum_brightwellii.AAC.1
MSESSSERIPLCCSKRGTGNEKNEETVQIICMTSQEITKGKIMQFMSTYSMSYCNGNYISMTPCLNEAHLTNNISSEQLEVTQKQD